MIETKYPSPAEKVVLAALIPSGKEKNLGERSLEEMKMLCYTAGADIKEVVVQRLDRPKSSGFFGSGKLNEIKNSIEESNASGLIVDAELSPGQVKTIEKKTGCKVIDRSQLILDIFAQHARTKEARIQVELAQLRTLYPRLTHAWSHFSKQEGAIGTRGPGEKQLEVDRRLVQRKISDLKGKLKKIDISRKTQRKSRKNDYNISIVGYTNVGKSSILNSLSGANVKVEDTLFATLDTSTRRVYIKGAGEAVLTDTVGFIHRLPHHLVASFKSTLQVINDSDMLIIVLDASSNWLDVEYETVKEVLRDLGAEELPHLIVLNKSDLVKDRFESKRLEISFPDSVLMSVFNKDDCVVLKENIGRYMLNSRLENKRIQTERKGKAVKKL